MRHRISAGVIVDVDDRILLVRHLKPTVYDFWVPPGGGVEGTEDLRATVQREARGVRPRSRIAADPSSGFATTRYLGVREMKV